MLKCRRVPCREAGGGWHSYCSKDESKVRWREQGAFARSEAACKCQLSRQVLSLDRKFLDPRRPVGKPSADDMEEMLVPYQPFVPIIPTAVLSYNNTIQQVCDSVLRLRAWAFARAPLRVHRMLVRPCVRDFHQTVLKRGVRVFACSLACLRDVPCLDSVALCAIVLCHQLRGFAVAPARIESTSLMLAFGVDLFFTRVSPAKAFDCLGEDFNYVSLVLAVLGLATISWVANWYANKAELDKAWK